MITVAWWPRSCIGGELRTVLLEAAFPKSSCLWVDDFTALPAVAGAVVILNGDTMTPGHLPGKHRPDMLTFNEQVKGLEWLLVVSLSDEGSSTRLDRITHPNASIWVQDAKPGLRVGGPAPLGSGLSNHDKFHRLPLGPTHQCGEFLPLFQKEMEEKPLDWFWAGNVRHTEIARAWLEATQALPGKGAVGFYPAISAYDYMRGFASAKVIPCRTAICTPETPRMYEALEAGCVPVVGTYPNGEGWAAPYDWPKYWVSLFGEQPPFPVIESPGQLAAAVRDVLDNWPAYSKASKTWWAKYKTGLTCRLRGDVLRLAGCVGDPADW